MTAPKRIPAFQFYPHAWLSSMSVTMMPAEVEGTYIRLLAQAWIGLTQGSGKLLPLDTKQLRTLTKLNDAQWKRAWPMLEEHFPVDESGKGRTNPTLQGVWRQQEDFREKQRENGANGGRPPKNPTPPKTKPNGKPEETQALPLATDLQIPNESTVTDTVTGNPLTPPDGGVPSPPPPKPVGNAAQYRADLSSAVSVIENADAQGAVFRFLDEQRCRPETWVSWIRRIVGWKNGLDTSSGKAVTWHAIVTGTHELLDVNPPSMRITPKVLRIFVEGAPDGTQHDQSTDDAWASLKQRAQRGEFAA